MHTENLNITLENRASMPVRRAYHTAVLLNELVYVGGGYESDMRGSYRIDAYNPVENLWNSPINSPQNFFAMTVLNDHLVIAGGEDKTWEITDKLFVMDTGQLKEYSTTLRAPRKLATAIGHKKMLIIVGGEDRKHRKLASTDLLDTSTMQWFTCSDLPQPHYWLQSVILDNTIYLLGGLDKDGNHSPMVFAAHLDTLSSHQLKWAYSPDLDTPWCSSAPVSINDERLVVVGGIKKIDENTKQNVKIKSKLELTTNVYNLNKAIHNWQAIGTIPLARYALTAISLSDNRIILFGGNDDTGHYTSNVWISSSV